MLLNIQKLVDAHDRLWPIAVLDNRICDWRSPDEYLGPSLQFWQFAGHVFLDLIARRVDLEDGFKLAWE
jgi:hypothetical protein